MICAFSNFNPRKFKLWQNRQVFWLAPKPCAPSRLKNSGGFARALNGDSQQRDCSGFSPDSLGFLRVLRLAARFVSKTDFVGKSTIPKGVWVNTIFKKTAQKPLLRAKKNRTRR